MNEAAPSALFAQRTVSPMLELGAWEWLWMNRSESYAGIADLFRDAPGSLPSDLAPEPGARLCALQALAQLAKAGITNFGVRVHGTADYPQSLREAEDPVELLYYQGWWDLVAAPRRIAVVGSSEISEKGVRRTAKLVKMLVQHRCTIVSGLARGVDTVAHEAAIEAGGATIGVAGTPLSEADAKSNARIRRQVATEYLLVSPVPVLAWGKHTAQGSRLFYPERGRTMSALAEATIIVEAGQISGAAAQGQAALRQGRRLFILNGCFDQPGVTWPAKFEAQGAIRVREFEQILDVLRGRDLSATTANR